MIARKASNEKHVNLIGGKVVQLQQNKLINLRGDKSAELFSYIDKKLTKIGKQSLNLASIAESKILSDG